jgi:hypothetical protein
LAINYFLFHLFSAYPLSWQAFVNRGRQEVMLWCSSETVLICSDYDLKSHLKDAPNWSSHILFSGR